MKAKTADTFNHESLTKLFLSVIDEKYSAANEVALFATAPKDTRKDGITTRLAIAGSIVDDFVAVLPIKGEQAVMFATRTQHEILSLAESIDYPHYGTLADLFDLDAPYRLIDETYRTVMREVAENAAHRAAVLINGIDIAANSNIPRLH